MVNISLKLGQAAHFVLFQHRSQVALIDGALVEGPFALWADPFNQPIEPPSKSFSKNGSMLWRNDSVSLEVGCASPVHDTYRHSLFSLRLLMARRLTCLFQANLFPGDCLALTCSNVDRGGKRRARGRTEPTGHVCAVVGVLTHSA